MASGDSLLIFLPANNEPPDADYATLDTKLTASTDEPDNVTLCLDFDDGPTNEFAVFNGVMPRHYSGGGVTCTIMWGCTSDTIGNGKWEIAWKSVTDDADDLDTKASAAANSVTDAAPSSIGELKYSEIAFTDGADMDSVAAGEYFQLRLNLDAADAAHTLTGDCEFYALEIRET